MIVLASKHGNDEGCLKMRGEALTAVHRRPSMIDETWLNLRSILRAISMSDCWSAPG
jgi:hypothetical protein